MFLCEREVAPDQIFAALLEEASSKGLKWVKIAIAFFRLQQKQMFIAIDNKYFDVRLGENDDMISFYVWLWLIILDCRSLDALIIYVCIGACLQRKHW